MWLSVTTYGYTTQNHKNVLLDGAGLVTNPWATSNFKVLQIYINCQFSTLNDHKLSGLEEHTFTPFWFLELQD